MNQNNDTAECCVCMTAESDDVPALRDSQLGHLLTLNDLDDDDLLQIKGNARSGAKQVLFLSSCEKDEHVICNYCLHHLATSFGGNHPIGPLHAMIPCPYPFDDCVTQITGLRNYFAHTMVEKILNDDEIERYRAHVSRYQFPGFELIPCPRPSRYGTTCDAGILVSLDDIRTRAVGRLVIQCDQSITCQRQTCYHCRSLVHRSMDYCESCVISTENANPGLSNCYFYRIDKVAGDGKPNLYRNDELTEDIIIQQLLEIIAADRLEIKCTECLTLMFKTELCNTLEHCGIERCYSCGRSATISKKLGDHWDSIGVRGCCRFDSSIFWNVMANCQFKCVETECYGNDIGDCTVEDHQAGIRSMIFMRKKAHIYHAIKSLLPEVRRCVLNKLSLMNNGIFRPFLPLYMSDDYRTYLPDCIKFTFEQAQKLLQEKDIDNDSIEIAQSIISKVSQLHFFAIQYPELPLMNIVVPEIPDKAKVLFARFKKRYIKPRKVKTKVTTTKTIKV